MNTRDEHCVSWIPVKNVVHRASRPIKLCIMNIWHKYCVSWIPDINTVYHASILIIILALCIMHIQTWILCIIDTRPINCVSSLSWIPDTNMYYMWICINDTIHKHCAKNEFFGQFDGKFHPEQRRVPIQLENIYLHRFISPKSPPPGPYTLVVVEVLVMFKFIINWHWKKITVHSIRMVCSLIKAE